MDVPRPRAASDPCAAVGATGSDVIPAGPGAVSCPTAGLFASLTAALGAGGAQAQMAVDKVCSDALALSFDASGCYVVLLALTLAGPRQVASILAGLRGSIAAAARSPHASCVLEAAIHASGAESSAAIAQELLHQGRGVATNQCGSQVVCRLLEHAAGEPRIVELTDKALASDVTGLCCHKFGHAAVIAILSNGLSRQRAVVVAALLGDLRRFAKHRYAALVLQHALLQCAPAECGALAHGLMAQAGAVVSVACHACGVHVIRALLQVPGATPVALQHISKGEHRLRKDLFGSQLLRELGLLEDKASDEAGATRVKAVVGGA